ncbi:NXPE family member 4-like [Mya arenaria]|uniref:NXPE family member 4-like n=1 Tax=Mya arenaria TaxID=6604 RepID=UPI0022E26CD8|nr:NXPE family member 4-like [Mya arenaria]
MNRRAIHTVVIVGALTLLAFYQFQNDVTNFRMFLTKSTNLNEMEGQGSAIFKAHIDDQDSKFEEDDFLPFPNLLKEEDTISDVQTNELDHVVSAEKSTITLLDRKEIYKLGDSIRVMIDLYDHAGHRKSSGGEMVRVILIGSDVPGTAVPGHVIDNGNGSYTAEIEALWTGKSRVSASLVYSRQSIAALYRMRRDMLSTRIIQAVFKSRNYHETTDCHPNITHLLKFRNYSACCNLTYVNSGMPWHCGRPRDIHLLCEDWHALNLQTDVPLPITKLEEKIISEGTKIISKAMDVQVVGNRRIAALPQSPCYLRNIQELWRERRSTGFFHNSTWHLRHCTGITRDRIPECIRHKSMYLLGDSTLRHWYEHYVLKILECKPTSEDWTKEKWHKPATCRNDKLNFSAGWFPFSAGNDENSYTLYSIARHIDDIPDNEEPLVVVHLFLHMVPYHHSVFQTKMELIRNSVVRLLRRNPNAKVFIKAPHTYLNSPAGRVRLNDFFGYLYTNILYKIFRGFHDKIVFLNNRDSSDSLRLEWNHPPPYVVQAMVEQLFSYACA